MVPRHYFIRSVSANKRIVLSYNILAFLTNREYGAVGGPLTAHLAATATVVIESGCTKRSGLEMCIGLETS
jgi:hypothetical protein